MPRRGEPSGGARSQRGTSAIYEDFRPVSEWKYEKGQQSHLLLIRLPGFSKERIRVLIKYPNTLRIRGERLIGRNKWSRFDEDFRILDDCNIRGIRAKFKSDTLTITMPKKGPVTTTTQVSPKKEGTQKGPLEALPKKPYIESAPAKIAQETKEKMSTKVTDKVEESKKDEYARGDSVKKANEVDDGNGKVSKPENYFEKKVEEESKKAKEKVSKEVMEGFNIGEETASIKPRNYFDKIDKEKSGEVKEKEKEKFNEVAEGLKIVNVTKEAGAGNGSFKHKNYIEKVKKKAKDGISIGGKDNEKENYKELLKGIITKGELEEDRQMVNIAVAALVIVALGAYLYYGSHGKAKV